MDTSTINVILRVLNPENKKFHTSFQLRDLPSFASVNELKAFIFKNYAEETGAVNTNFEVGYYGKPGFSRFTITNEVHLAEAMSLENRGWVTLWVHVASSKSKGKASTSSQKARTTNAVKRPCLSTG